MTASTKKKSGKKNDRPPSKQPIGWWVDEHQRLKSEVDELQQKLNEAKRELNEFAEKALEKFGKEGLEGARGEHATGFVEERDHFNISDRREFEKYVKRTGHLELFQGRVSAEAYRELSSQGKKIPGVGIFTKRTFRTRKR